MQRIVFEAARDVYDQMQPTWKGNREVLLAQVIRLVEKFIASDRDRDRTCSFQSGRFAPPHHSDREHDKRSFNTFSSESASRMFTSGVLFSTASIPRDVPGTCARGIQGGHASWRKRAISIFACMTVPGKQRRPMSWRRSRHVEAWVKNDHLGFEILCIWQGVVKKYRPDFLIRLANGVHLDSGGERTGLTGKPEQAAVSR